MAIEARVCQNCKNRFGITPEDLQFYERMRVPPPTFCPECRAQRRMAFWNERNLYRKKEFLEGKEIFSTYPEQSPIKIYEHSYWWSDKWDPMTYGRGYDFSRPFFAQFRDLLYAVPRSSREIKTLTRSDYCDNSNNLKDCYLCFDASYCDDCLYSVQVYHSKDSLDITFAARMELCCEVLSANHCFQTFFTIESDNCRDVWFSRDCEDCDHCFGCVNLRHKQYHIFNVPYGKKEYEEKIAALDLGSYKSFQEVRRKAREFWNRHPYRFMHGTHNENVIGDYVYHSKDVYRSYEIDDSKNVRYSQRQMGGTQDICDATSWGDESELLYETLVCGEHCRNLKFCMFCWPAARDLEYCASCHSSSNLFGCVGLRNKQYCILNKQYSEEEYRALTEKIRAHMNEMPYVAEIPPPEADPPLEENHKLQIPNERRGASDSGSRNYREVVYKYGEFYPPDISPLAYNETAANGYFPLTKEEAVQKGLAWREPGTREYAITLPAERLPDHIRDASLQLAEEIAGCLACKRAYRILAREIEFYKRFQIPLPRLCHNCRYRERLKLRNPLRWHKRKCQCAGTKSQEIEPGFQYQNAATHPHGQAPCSNEFETSYAPERPEIIYCEQCYQAEVA